MAKAYIPIEGSFYTNWEYYCNKVFLTKTKLHKFMKEKNGFGFTMKDREFEVRGMYWSNENEEYGYIIEEVEVI